MARTPGRAFFQDRLSPSAARVLDIAEHEAIATSSAEVTNLHLLLGMLEPRAGLAAEVLRRLEISREEVLYLLKAQRQQEDSASIPPGEPRSLSPEVMAALDSALQEAEAEGQVAVDAAHLLIALSEMGGDSMRPFDRRGVDARIIQRLVSEGRVELGERPIPEADESSASKEDASADAAETAARTERLEAVPTHRDGPATVDDLRRADFAEVLGERMRRVRGENTELPARSWREKRRKRRRDATEAKLAGPFMVHVHAPWGAGKSSLLNFLAADLRNRRSVDGSWLRRAFDFLFGRRQAGAPHLSRWIVVQFNAWEHQRLATPWWWLLAAMQRSCGRELWWIDRRRWAWFWARDVAWRIWNVRVAVLTVAVLAALVGLAWALEWFGLADESLTTLQAALLTVGSAAALATTLFSIVRGAGRWLAIGSAEAADRFLKRARDPLGVYRRRFRWLVHSAGGPIAVFIDDLDRCRSEYVVELLEGIQTLFASEPVAYVVAADRAWLYRSFGKTYEDFEGGADDPSRPLGFRFLEKTFQISMEIPPMSDQARSDFWDLLLGVPPAGPEDGSGRELPADAFAEASTQQEVESRSKALVDAGIKPEDVYAGAVRRFNSQIIEQQTEMLLSRFAPLLERNPRAMKRLVNAYGFERDLLIRRGHFLSEEERRQLALLTILRLRWPLFADHLRDNPTDADFLTEGADDPPGNHQFEQAFADPDLHALFRDTVVGTKLDRSLIESFPRTER